MPRVTQEHRRARREQILVAAARCFAREGLHRASMQAIMTESGLSAGAIYSYFNSRDEIVEAIADHRHAAEFERLANALSLDHAERALAYLGEEFIGPLHRRGGQLERRMGIELWAEALHNPRLRRIVRRGIDQPRRRLAQLIDRAQTQGQLRDDIDAEALARVLIAMFHGLVLQQAWDPGVDLDRYQSAVDLLLESLFERPRERGNRAR
jgi:AcrR family transcriptional regulator